MKKCHLILLFLFLLGLVSCVKQKNCEGGIIGMFQYLDNPKYVSPYCQFRKEKVSAILIIGNQEKGQEVDSYREIDITGNIPKEFRSGDLIKVSVMLQDTHENDRRTMVCSGVYKLMCIEKVK